MPLVLSNLHGFNAVSEAGVSDAFATYRSSYQSAANNTHYVSGALAIGPAASNKMVIAVISGRALSGTLDTSVVKIGGVTATEILSNPSSGLTYLGIWGAVVPGVTTATVDVTFQDTSSEFYADLFSAENLSSLTPIDQSTVATVDPIVFADTINVPAGGIIIGGVLGLDSATVHVWTGLTKIHESNAPGAQMNMSSAYVASATGDSALAFSVDVPGRGVDAVIVSLR